MTFTIEAARFAVVTALRLTPHPRAALARLAA